MAVISSVQELQNRINSLIRTGRVCYSSNSDEENDVHLLGRKSRGLLVPIKDIVATNSDNSNGDTQEGQAPCGKCETGGNPSHGNYDDPYALLPHSIRLIINKNGNNRGKNSNRYKTKGAIGKGGDEDNPCSFDCCTKRLQEKYFSGYQLTGTMVRMRLDVDSPPPQGKRQTIYEGRVASPMRFDDLMSTSINNNPTENYSESIMNAKRPPIIVSTTSYKNPSPYGPGERMDCCNSQKRVKATDCAYVRDGAGQYVVPLIVGWEKVPGVAAHNETVSPSKTTPVKRDTNFATTIEEQLQSHLQSFRYLKVPTNEPNVETKETYSTLTSPIHRDNDPYFCTDKCADMQYSSLSVKPHQMYCPHPTAYEASLQLQQSQQQQFYAMLQTQYDCYHQQFRLQLQRQRQQEQLEKDKHDMKVKEALLSLQQQQASQFCGVKQSESERPSLGYAYFPEGLNKGFSVVNSPSEVDKPSTIGPMSSSYATTYEDTILPIPSKKRKCHMFPTSPSVPPEWTWWSPTKPNGSSETSESLSTFCTPSEQETKEFLTRSQGIPITNSTTTTPTPNSKPKLSQQQRNVKVTELERQIFRVSNDYNDKSMSFMNQTIVTTDDEGHLKSRHVTASFERVPLALSKQDRSLHIPTDIRSSRIGHIGLSVDDHAATIGNVKQLPSRPTLLNKPLDLTPNYDHIVLLDKRVKTYMCKRCLEILKSEQDIHNHLFCKMLQNTVQCHICSNLFPSEKYSHHLLFDHQQGNSSNYYDTNINHPD